jgi:hypothetical protein
MGRLVAAALKVTGSRVSVNCEMSPRERREVSS